MEPVHRRIEARAERSPEAVALLDGGRATTHRALDERANRLAHLLIRGGVERGTRVGVACTRSADMIAAVLAVLKAGGAYVPIDPSHPREHTDFLLADAKVPLLVTQVRLADRFARGAVRVVFADDPAPLAALPATRPPVASTADDDLFVLYTSGSTGRPKGVIGVHRAIASRLRWAEVEYPYEENEIASARTPLGFVDSVAEIFAPLACGVPLVVLGDESHRDPIRMIEELAAVRATRIVLVPSMLATLFELAPDLGARLPALRYWFVGGEPVPVPLAVRFLGAMPGRKLVNIYGATELSGDATAYDFDHLPAGLATSPIGVPLPGVFARVLDEQLAEVPDGQSGEVCVSGVCVARGYVDRPELEAVKFVPNPHPEGGRLYRTGDLGRRLPTGDLQYLGRLDSLVKIRGMRVELGEVEARVAELPGVAQAVAVAREDALGARSLAVFYTPGPAGAPPPDELRAALARRVPEYLVPGQLVELSAFPVSPNGKIDRRALRDRPLPAAAAPDLPVGELERRVAEVWEAVLEQRPIGRWQSFHELGGHSLAAARIVARLREELDRELAIGAVFVHPTVAALAAHLAELPRRPRAPRASASARCRVVPPVLPLSHHQVPFWFFTALTGGASVVSEAFAISPVVPPARLEAAFSASVAAFDALWMQFPRWRPVQRPVPRRPCGLVVRDLRGSTRPDAELLQEEADANHALDFDPQRPPHVHGRLVWLPSGEQRLLVAIPHIAVDMTAMELFRRTLQDELAGRRAAVDERTARAPTLRDRIEWERGGLARRKLGADSRHFRALGGGAADNALPARLFRSKLAGRRVRAFCRRELSPELVEGLASYSRGRAVSLPMTLIGCIGAAVARVGGLEALTLLLMLEKRDDDSARTLFGTLASLMPCRLDGLGQRTLDELIGRLGAQLLASYEHADPLMLRPTLFNDFWSAAPRPVARLVERLSRAGSRLVPEARLDERILAEYFFALVPSPVGIAYRALDRLRRRSVASRRILVAVNVLPEVYQAEDAAPGEVRVSRKRDLPLILKPDDLVVGSDLLLDLTLQIHLTRNERGRIVVNLYGGGIDPEGLEEIGDGIVVALSEAGGARGAAPVLGAPP